MQVITSIKEVRQAVKELRAGEKKSVGFVPTMGCLHQGHLSLVRGSRAENDISIVSIFVNPTQFGPNEDFEDYPRDLKRDLELLNNEAVDLVFHPQPEEIYPPHFHTTVRVRKITEVLEGNSRPGHFDGVATVVSKLLNIIQPDRAYFGAKDAQQFRVVEAMVRDLNFDVTIRAIPTAREPDGLAMSSRNIRLSPEERKSAVCLFASLEEAKKMIAAGERDPALVRERMREIIEAHPHVEIDYVHLNNWETLDETHEMSGDVLVSLAVFVGRTRLIDNTVIRVETPGVSPENQ